MKKNNLEQTYKFSHKGLEKPEKFEKHINKAASEIVDQCGQNVSLRFHVEPEVKDKDIFKLTLVSMAPGSNLVIKKKGRNIYHLIKKIKRKFIRSNRRKLEFKRDKKRKVIPIGQAKYQLEKNMRELYSGGIYENVN